MVVYEDVRPSAGIFGFDHWWLLGVVALGVDVLSIYWNKGRLRAATDATTLADSERSGGAEVHEARR